MFTTAEDVNERRLRILQLHVDELRTQASSRAELIQSANTKIKALERERSLAQPQERKLFSKLERVQAELKLARDQRASADARSSELSEQLERVVEAARVEAESPGQKMLLQVTTDQLEATKIALRQAQEQSAAAARDAQTSEEHAATAATQQAQAEQREVATSRRLLSLLEKSAAASLLNLPPPSKGHDLAEQHHILELNFRHLQAELQRKSIAAEGLIRERDELLSVLNVRIPAQQEQAKRARTEQAKRQQETREQMVVAQQQLERHLEQLERARQGSAGDDGEHERIRRAGYALAVPAKVAAAVWTGALNGFQRRAASSLALAEASRDELRASLNASETACRERCSALEAEAADVRAAGAEALEQCAMEAKAAAAELAERTLAIEALEEKLGAAQHEVDTTQAELVRTEAERKRAAQDAADASALASSAATREGQTKAEAEAHAAAREELTTEHDQLLRQFQELQDAQLATQTQAAAAARTQQEERQLLRQQLEQAAERERGLSEALAREQHSRQASVEQLHDLQRAAPAGDLEERLHEARKVAATAQAEAASLRVQVDQMRSAREAILRRETDMDEQLRRAQEQTAKATEQLQGITANHAEQRAQSRSQQAQLQAQSTERERETSRRNAELEGECSRLREQLRAQDAASSRQVAELQLAVRQAASASAAMVPSPPLLTPPPVSPTLRAFSSPAPQLVVGSPLPAQQQELFDRLQTQQALAQKRESVAVELRQLAESYKAKAERLGQQLVEERERAAAQSELWKQQLQALRARSRADRERLRVLMMHDDGRAASPAHGCEYGADVRTPNGASTRSSAPRSGASSMGSTPPTNGSNGSLRRGVGRVISTASSIDAKVRVALLLRCSGCSLLTLRSYVLQVDRALDRVDGIVGRFATSRGATNKAGSFTPLSTEGD